MQTKRYRAKNKKERRTCLPDARDVERDAADLAMELNVWHDHSFCAPCYIVVAYEIAMRTVGCRCDMGWKVQEWASIYRLLLCRSFSPLHA